MKLRRFLALILALALPTFNSVAKADVGFEMPQLVSLDFTPKEIDLSLPGQSVKVTLKVSHPYGIKNESVNAWIRNGTIFESYISLKRTDSPINPSLANVTFEGTWVPTNVPGAGVYKITADGVTGVGPSRTATPTTSSFTPANFRDLPGAENALLVKNFGNMLGFETYNVEDENTIIESLFNIKDLKVEPGLTPAEIDIELWRRVFINAYYLWKSKGTRKAVEFFLRFIGTPQGLVKFNEYIKREKERVRKLKEKDFK